MNISKLRSLGTAIGGGVVGITGHFYGSKILSYREDKAEDQMQSHRDQVLFELKEKIENLGNDIGEMKTQINTNTKILEAKGEDAVSQFQSDFDSLGEVLEDSRKSLDEGLKSLDKSLLDTIDDVKVNQSIDLFTASRDSMLLATNQFNKLIDKMNNPPKFWGESELTAFYKYLDTLSLFELSAFFHSVFVITIMCIIWNIYSVLFANEIIKYFNLETKYPKLNKFFKLRLQFQRYYLIFNLLLFLTLCIFVLGINLLVLV